MPQVKCPNCHAKIDVDKSAPKLSCIECGKTYKNPFFKPEIDDNIQMGVVAPFTPEAPQNTDTESESKAVVATGGAVEEEKTGEKPVRKVKKGKSEFTGGLGSLIGNRILNTLIIIFTLSLGTPWVICRGYRWKLEHQIIDGRKLVFDGKAGQLFGQWIKWILLTIITIGIYGFWIPIKKLRWITEHTHIARPSKD